MRVCLVAASLVGGAAAPAFGASVIVDIAGIAAATGNVRVALYADAAAFDARDAAFARAVPARVPGVSVVFDDVPPGDYAALAFHDVDADGELRRGAFGIPVEPWAGSTSGTRFRAPSWGAYAVTLPDDGLRLELRF